MWFAVSCGVKAVLSSLGVSLAYDQLDAVLGHQNTSQYVLHRMARVHVKVEPVEETGADHLNLVHGESVSETLSRSRGERPKGVGSALFLVRRREMIWKEFVWSLPKGRIAVDGLRRRIDHRTSRNRVSIQHSVLGKPAKFTTGRRVKAQRLLGALSEEIQAAKGFSRQRPGVVCEHFYCVVDFFLAFSLLLRVRPKQEEQPG